MKPILAIDQGSASGGLAWRDKEGNIHAVKMPKDMTDMVDLLRELYIDEKLELAVIEKVGYHRFGNSARASSTFARHCGHVEAALYTLGLSTVQVDPKTWQAHHGNLPTDKKKRKDEVKKLMACKYTHLKVISATSDALGILDYAIHKYK